jgi:hypothetical protein
MKPSHIKKYGLLLGLPLVLVLACLALVIFFFARMYQHDMKSLTDFVASYQAYDKAAAAASASILAENRESSSLTDAERRQLEAALSDLKTKSSAQISSLIKNEDEAMRAMQEIANLSDKEVSTLKAYLDAAGQDANRDGLEQAFHDLAEERQEVFTHFQKLGQ